MKVFLEASWNQRAVASGKRNSKVVTHSCLIFCVALLPCWLIFLTDRIGNLGSTYNTSSVVPGLLPCRWQMGWRSPPMRPVLPVPSSSCGLGWAAAWSEWGCWAPRYPHWVSSSSCPGSPGNPGAPGSTDRPHPPPQIPVSSLEQRQLEKDLLRRWRHVWRQYLLPITVYSNVIYRQQMWHRFVTGFHFASCRCESSTCACLQCVPPRAIFLWFCVDFYWYKQT